MMMVFVKNGRISN